MSHTGKQIDRQGGITLVETEPTRLEIQHYVVQAKKEEIACSLYSVWFWADNEDIEYDDDYFQD